MINSEFLTDPLTQFIPAVLLYAELHFRFKWTGSRYFQKEPEILADLPVRIEPESDIPILLIIKDSHLFPISLKFVEVVIFKSSKIIQSHTFQYNSQININWWDDTIMLNLNGIFGEIEINVEFTYNINGKNKKCTIHNYPLCTHDKLKTYISKYRYPNDDNVLYGDIHYHSNLTEDMVEFGAPLKATLTMAESLGLDFFCNTDHSYDLDDIPGSWTESDPNLEKWNKSRSEIKTLNKNISGKSFIIPSEELSLHNKDGRNVHALILNNSKFLPGSGDGAEEPFNFQADYNTKTVHSSLDKGSLCISAHPFNPVPLVQWFFVKRGKWKLKDIVEDNIAGIQIINGALDEGFYEGLEIWKKLLLGGYKKYIYAGNDAHGNFNIFRQIKTPMLSLFEKKEQLFGEFRTGVHTNGDNKTIETVVTSMKNGNCFVTNGPFINLTYQDNGHIYEMGNAVISNYGIITISIISTPEFGMIKKITIIKGIIGDNKEVDIFTIMNPRKYKLIKDFEINIIGSCYLRCEVEITSNNAKRIFAMSNPIWFSPNIN
ncbi:MAG: hypothetical protein H8E85_07695 [Candidatus Marinimicrobia bacterium]|nr:hypothetical protein [Candidatus Neomarinimicrobiota bacterium]